MCHRLPRPLPGRDREVAGVPGRHDQRSGCGVRCGTHGSPRRIDASVVPELVAEEGRSAADRADQGASPARRGHRPDGSGGRLRNGPTPLRALLTTTAGSVVGSASLPDLGAGEERCGADLHRDVGDAPPIRDDSSPRRRAERRGPRSRRGRPDRARRSPHGSVTGARGVRRQRPVVATEAEQPQVGPIVGPNWWPGRGGRRGRGRRRNDALVEQPSHGPAADPPHRGHGPVAHHLEPRAPGEASDTARLGEAGGGLRLQPGPPIPPRRSAPSRRTRRLDVVGEAFGVSRAHADTRLVPAPLLDRDAEGPQRRHHLGRGRLVGGAVRGEEHGVGALAGGGRSGIPELTPYARAS